MSFNINARILLELGGELISSDSIALYELIKNAKDAGSPTININVCVGLTKSGYESFNYQLTRFHSDIKQNFQLDAINQYFSPLASEDLKNDLIQQLFKKTNKEAAEIIKSFYQKHTFIDVNDFGEGMSLSDVESHYLTLGTSHRAKQKEEDKNKLILGEKGIGRLSVMRLGKKLTLETTTANDKYWTYLEIDWEKLENDIDAPLSSFKTTPAIGRKKTVDEKHGTRIRISNLNEDWSYEKLILLGQNELSRLTNPFDRNATRLGLKIYFNSKEIENFSTFQPKFLSQSHGKFEVKLKENPEIPDDFILEGEVEFRPVGKSGIPAPETDKSHIKMGLEELSSVLGDSDSKLANGGLSGYAERFIGIRSLGEFSVKGYWYNRQRFREEIDNSDYKEFKTWIDRWAGGLSLYRDGYRVYPYATPDDDWLELDKKALSGRAYKLNRAQLVGYVNISSRKNRFLQDQTNRQGLRDTPEKRALVRCLQHIIWTELGNLVKKYEEKSAKVSVKEFEEVDFLVISKTKAARKTLNSLYKELNPTQQIELAEIKQYCDEVESAWAKAKVALKDSQKHNEQYLHLASVGLMLEFIVHELTRTAKTTLDNVLSIRSTSSNPAIESLFHQLKSLNKRLRILDPISTPGRQVKSTVAVKKVLNNLLESHSAQFERHKINVKVDINNKQEFEANIVEGYLYQVIENLISNSVYWTDHHRAYLAAEDSRNLYQAEITVSIDTNERTITFKDNGSGITKTNKNKIFTPFYSLKPKKQGRGLGLYIAKKLCDESDMSISLGEADDDGIYREFIIKFP
ncbi:MAG TPA: sensor histidine kinase [Methylotenera sp.]|nr:sensor histidine kinase [Methylotenera sp.]